MKNMRCEGAYATITSLLTPPCDPGRRAPDSTLMYHEFILALDRLSDFFPLFIGLSWLVAVAAVVIFRLEKTRPAGPAICIGIAVLSVVLCLGSFALIEAEARKELKAYLSEGAPIDVFIDGEPAQKAADLLTDLASVVPESNQHASPTREFTLKLTSVNGTMLLVLAGDSAIFDKYWVFFPRYRSTASSERIGVMRTKVLDRY